MGCWLAGLLPGHSPFFLSRFLTQRLPRSSNSLRDLNFLPHFFHFVLILVLMWLSSAAPYPNRLALIPLGGVGVWVNLLPDPRASGFTVSTNSISNTALVQFPSCSGGSATATNWSVGVLNAGGGEILYSGALAGSLSISSGIQPQFVIGALNWTEA